MMAKRVEPLRVKGCPRTERSSACEVVVVVAVIKADVETTAIRLSSFTAVWPSRSHSMATASVPPVPLGAPSVVTASVNTHVLAVVCSMSHVPFALTFVAWLAMPTIWPSERLWAVIVIWIRSPLGLDDDVMVGRRSEVRVPALTPLPADPRSSYVVVDSQRILHHPLAAVLPV